MAKLFLDIDGVLNGHEHCHFKRPQFARINNMPAKVLQEIIDRTNPDVWIISLWGSWIIDGSMTAAGFANMLKTHGLYINVVGAIKTSGDPEKRSKSVAERLPALEPYCVIDDLPLRIPRLVRPDPGLGLLPYHVKQCVEFLMEMVH